MTDLDMLSPRELEVLRLFTIEALTHQQIAQKLGVSRRTINTHITHVTSKLERH